MTIEVEAAELLNRLRKAIPAPRRGRPEKALAGIAPRALKMLDDCAMANEAPPAALVDLLAEVLGVDMNTLRLGVSTQQRESARIEAEWRWNRGEWPTLRSLAARLARAGGAVSYETVRAWRSCPAYAAEREWLLAEMWSSAIVAKLDAPKGRKNAAREKLIEQAQAWAGLSPDRRAREWMTRLQGWSGPLEWEGRLFASRQAMAEHLAGLGMPSGWRDPLGAVRKKG